MAPGRIVGVYLMACLSAWSAERAPSVTKEHNGSGRDAAADIRVDSNLVLIPVSVTDSRNHPVTGLHREDFRVFEGRTEQRLMQFASEDEPVSVGIVFDASGSMSDKLASSREAVARFLATAGPRDEFFLVNFSSAAQIAVPFTADAGSIQNRLLYTGSQGRTSLLDAVCLAMDYIRKASNPRRALLVISDGIDNHSRFTESEIQRRVRESDVWIYAISVGAHVRRMLPEEDSGEARMETIAEESGGRLFVARNPAAIVEAAATIGLQLRNQYVIGYRPSNVMGNGKYHKVQVKVTDGRALRLTWRPGYFEPE